MHWTSLGRSKVVIGQKIRRTEAAATTMGMAGYKHGQRPDLIDRRRKESGELWKSVRPWAVIDHNMNDLRLATDRSRQQCCGPSADFISMASEPERSEIRCSHPEIRAQPRTFLLKTVHSSPNCGNTRRAGRARWHRRQMRSHRPEAQAQVECQRREDGAARRTHRSQKRRDGKKVWTRVDPTVQTSDGY